MGDAVQTLPRRLLGSELKRLRTKAGRSLDEAAEAIGKDRSRMIKLENGRSNLKSTELEQLLTLFGASAVDRKKVLAMGVEARQRQPKRAYVDLLPGAHRRIADLEAQASAIRYYDRGVISGLLQIPEYTEAQMASGDGVWWESSYQERVNRVAFRLERQKSLLSKQLVFVLTDDSLTVQVGGPQVMRRQIEHLLRVSEERSNVKILVLSSTEPRNPCPQGALVLLEFDTPAPTVGLLPVAYGPSAYLDEPADTAALARCFERLQELAFDEEESRLRLEAALERI